MENNKKEHMILEIDELNKIQEKKSRIFFKKHRTK